MISQNLAGVHRLVIPLPFKMEALNAWLVDTGDGWTLVDTGMQTVSGWNSLNRVFTEAGGDWKQLSRLVITHMHPDHVGLAPQVKEASGAPLAMHALDADLLGEFTDPNHAEYWNGVALDLAGSPPEMKGPVNAAFHLLTVKFPSIDPEIVLHGGERFGRFEVLWTPGHSPGHVCLYDRDRRLLISGDHILEVTSPNIGWLPDGDPLGDYLQSVGQLRELEIDLVLPGHGEPIEDHRAWIDGTIAHHQRRCARIVDMAREQPISAHAMLKGLWTRELDPIHYRFAIFEVLAHCKYLEKAGALRSEGVLWLAEHAV